MLQFYFTTNTMKQEIINNKIDSLISDKEIISERKLISH